jgi:hypothetical protein
MLENSINDSISGAFAGAAEAFSGNLSTTLWNDMKSTLGALAGGDKESSHLNDSEAIDFSVAEIYSCARRADAPLESDNAADELEESVEHNDIGQERCRLSEVAARKIEDPSQLEKFNEDMITFEERATKQGVSNAEVAKTYHQLARMLEPDRETPLTSEQREALARQIIEQAADPTRIDQGQHNTCNITTIETRIYTRTPSAAAELVTDMALKGEFETLDGTVVKLPDSSLQPMTEATLDSPVYGDRSYASQIFQLTAVNVHYARENAATTPPGQKQYEQIKTDVDGDNGERLFDYSSGSPIEVVINGQPARQPHLNISQYQEIHNQIAKGDDSGFLLAHSDSISHSTLENFDSEESLRTKLVEMKEAGAFPAIIRIDSWNEPFLSDSGGGEAGGSGQGWHVVTVTDFDSAADRVSIDNQWGELDDRFGERGVSVQDLYLASRESTSDAHLDEMEKVITDNSENGLDTSYKELDLMRLNYAAELEDITEAEKAMSEIGTLVAGIVGSDTIEALSSDSFSALRNETDEKFDRTLSEWIVNNERDWEINESLGLLDNEEVKQIDQKLELILGSYPEDRLNSLTAMIVEESAKQPPLHDEWSVGSISADPLAEMAKRHPWWYQIASN